MTQGVLRRDQLHTAAADAGIREEPLRCIHQDVVTSFGERTPVLASKVSSCKERSQASRTTRYEASWVAQCTLASVCAARAFASCRACLSACHAFSIRGHTRSQHAA